MEHHKAYQTIHNGSLRTGETKRGRKIFQEIMAENVPNLVKNINL